eukprot:5124294-Heterocapsa_arctica.AAC.1
MKTLGSLSALDGLRPTSNKTNTAAGVSYEDWYGNDQADVQAKAGAEKHGYTRAHKVAIEQK